MADEDEIVDKYKKRLEQELGLPAGKTPHVISQEYQDFKRTFLPRHLTIYERACQITNKVLKIRPNSKRSAELMEAIRITHLEVTPSSTVSFAIIIPIIIGIFAALLGFLVLQSLFLVGIILIGSMALIFPLQKLPDFLANNWRLKSSNQMVQCIFYTVTYMRHTSNLERAIEFASDRLGPPLSLDLKKVLWDVETGEFETIKDSLDHYLDSWKKWNREFIESFHLIESSLYEPSESRRLDVLDKGLSVMLTETYEKMLHYAHNLQGPITMLHMMGIILPILGLVILPLVVSFMAGDDVRPGTLALYIAILYNLLLPIGVYYLSKIVLSKRPTGYGQTDITDENPELAKYKNIIIRIGKSTLMVPPIVIAGTVFLLFLLLGVSPLVIHAVNPSFDFTFYGEAFQFLGYVCPEGSQCSLAEQIGPYGLGAALLSLFVTLAVGIGAGLYFALRSKNVFKIREKTKKLEDEFASALFQLGNRLGDGIPAEIAFGKVAQVMKGTTSGEFFALANQNITERGMSVHEAIFNRTTGALVYFPSNAIESSMRVLVESTKKGPKIAAQALISMSRYMKEIHRVDERLKDLLADIIASMKGQIRFLTPAIAGIVIGITSMITTILIKLSKQIALLTEQGTQAATAGVGGIVTLFGNGVPAYYFQIIVGVYVVQITFVLTILSNGIENGSDKLQERYLLGKYMISATILFAIISLVVILLFNVIAGQILSNTLV
jgi:hypothetical protein